MTFIYIMTNPAYEGYVKIGSTSSSVEQRRKELSTPPGVMFPFEIYAYYETTKSLGDKTLHKIIDKLNPKLRVNKRREFYQMSPSEAYSLLEGIAELTGTTEMLTLVNEEETEEVCSVKKRKPPFSFKSAGIPVGSVLEYTENPEIKVTVTGDSRNNISCNDEPYSLSKLAQKLLDSKFPVQGTLYFTYEGETLNERRHRLEEEGKYK